MQQCEWFGRLLPDTIVIHELHLARVLRRPERILAGNPGWLIHPFAYQVRNGTRIHIDDQRASAAKLETGAIFRIHGLGELNDQLGQQLPIRPHTPQRSYRMNLDAMERHGHRGAVTQRHLVIRIRSALKAKHGELRNAHLGWIRQPLMDKPGVFARRLPCRSPCCLQIPAQVQLGQDLIERGHRLVADDLVMTIRKNDQILIGEGRKLADHHLEIRGLGLVDVKRLFGIRSIRRSKRIEVVVELVPWDPTRNFDRTGLEEHFKEINGVKLPYVLLPVHPGKNITVLSETIALNHLLKLNGINIAQEFNERLIKAMSQKNREKKEYLDFMKADYE